MDSVFIRELRVEAIVGIYPWERRVPQEMVIDVEMAWDTSIAAKSERIEDALDYGAVSMRIRELVVASKFQLLETLAEQTVKTLMQEYSIPWVQFSVYKTQALAGVGGVGISIARGER